MKVPAPPPAAFRAGRHFEFEFNNIDDPYFMHEKPAGPAVCRDCAVVFVDGNWKWAEAPPNAHSIRCPACRRIADRLPAGYLTIEGQFAQQHREEIQRLIRNLEAHEKEHYPMQRIIAIEEADDKLVLTTTDMHLARNLGTALYRAYQGELELHYNKAEYLLRVRWQR